MRKIRYLIAGLFTGYSGAQFQCSEVGFVAYKVVMEWACPAEVRFPLSLNIPPIFDTHLSSGASRGRTFEEAVSRGSFLPHWYTWGREVLELMKSRIHTYIYTYIIHYIIYIIYIYIYFFFFSTVTVSPVSRVLWEVNRSSARQEISPIWWKPEVRYLIHKLSLNWVILTYCLWNWTFK